MHHRSTSRVTNVVVTLRVTPHEDVCLVVVYELKTRLEWFDPDIVT